MTTSEKIQFGSNMATIAGVIASLIFAILSQCTSSKALKITEGIKAETERVDIAVNAEFDELKSLILLPSDSTRRKAVLQLYANLSFNNNNQYRAIRIDDVYPTFGPSSHPSELEITLLQDGKKSTKTFSVSPIETVEKSFMILWPIDKQLAVFISNLLKTNKDLKISDLKLEIGNQPDLGRSNTNRKITLHVRTTPAKTSEDEIICTLILHS